MAVTVQFRRGTTAQNNAFTGSVGELSINTTTNTIRVHDGSTAGGHELMKADATNIDGNVPIGNISGTISASALDDGSSIDGGTY
jgi:hypothetical protein|tara:strand:- start:313 stop:567 length:255 start_codon:yes stop_codon:yes gene_type:complete